MTESSQQFRGTHTAPAAGIPTWPSPGDSVQGPRLDPFLPVHVLNRLDDWCQVVCANGWSTWVDASVRPVTYVTHDSQSGHKSKTHPEHVGPRR